MKNFLQKLVNFYNKLEENVLIFSLIVTVLLIFYQVIMRRVFHNSSYWSEELARYIFMWQIWLGASIGFRENQHIRIELLTGRLKGKVKTAFAIISNLVLLALCFFLIYQGWIFLAKIASMNMVTPALRIPFTLVYGSLPFSCLIICFRLAGEMFRQFKAFFSPALAADGGEN